MKKFIAHKEIVYFISIIILALAVAMVTISGFGLSMVVAPAFVLSEKIDFLTFGMAEYVVQTFVLILMCILIKKFKPLFLTAFLTTLIYGLVLDLFQMIPVFDSSVNIIEDIPILVRGVFFLGGEILTAFAVALSFKTYLYPQVCDLFLKTVSQKFNVRQTIIVYLYDLGCLIVALVMSLLFFGEIRGINFGTIFLVLVNGVLIGNFSRLLNKLFEFKPFFPKIERYFEISNSKQKQQVVPKQDK